MVFIRRAAYVHFTNTAVYFSPKVNLINQYNIYLTLVLAECGISRSDKCGFFFAFRWQKVFRSRLVSAIQRHINIYYSIFFVVLVVVFLGEFILFALVNL